jgi:hypothetical protein
MAVSCLTLFLMGSSRLAVAHSNIARSSASLDQRVLLPISIAVFAPLDIRKSLVKRVFDEAETIWGPTGIAFDWRRIRSKEAGGWQVTVTIDDQRRDFAESQGALGWIPFTARRVRATLE